MKRLAILVALLSSKTKPFFWEAGVIYLLTPYISLL